MGKAMQDTDSNQSAPLARARPTRASDETVVIIGRLMVNHSYNGEETIRELAETRGLSEHTVRRYVEEAARFIRLSRDPEAVKDWGLFNLNRLVENDGEDEEGRPHVPAAAKVAAIKVALDAVAARDPGLGKPGYGAPAQLPFEEHVMKLCEALAAPESPLIEALRRSGAVVLQTMGREVLQQLLASPDSELSEALRGASESVRKVIDG